MRALLPLLLLPSLALAQDGFQSYDEEESEEAPAAPTRQYEPGAALDEADQEGPRTFSRLDDPNVGLGLEAVGGLLLLDGSRGQGVDPRLGLGLRATWELGRTLAQEALRERLLLDVAWWTGGAREGTPSVYGDTRLHYLSAAPAWLFPLGGEGSPWGAYVQLGAGLALQDTAITASGVTTRLGGLKPLFQYGGGLRGRLKVAERLHLSLRAELTRFRRGYLDDTLLGASVGTAF